MALAKTLRFGEQLLLWGDGNNPETFTPLCGFTSLELTVNIETNSTNVPDCDDPDLPAWLRSSEVSKQMQLGGNGVIDVNALNEFKRWIMEGGEKRFRWLTDGDENPESNGYWEAPGILSAYGQTAERGLEWNQSTTILLNGRPTYVDLTAVPRPEGVPLITGTPEVGEVLTVTPGTWSPVASSYGYAWYRDGAQIIGQDEATYTLTAADEGKIIRARITGVNPSGSYTVNSAELGPIAPGA